MKKIGISLLCVMMLSLVACSQKKEYKRDTSEGEYIELSYKEMKEKVKSGDTFIALISQTACEHCQTYKKEVLKPYLKKHHLEIYELNITNEENPQETFTDVQNYINKLTDDEDMHFFGTPYTFVIDNGKLKEGFSGALDKDQLDDVVTDYQLDAK